MEAEAAASLPPESFLVVVLDDVRSDYAPFPVFSFLLAADAGLDRYGAAARGDFTHRSDGVLHEIRPELLLRFRQAQTSEETNDLKINKSIHEEWNTSEILEVRPTRRKRSVTKALHAMMQTTASS